MSSLPPDLARLLLLQEQARRRADGDRLAALVGQLVEAREGEWTPARTLSRALRMFWGKLPPKRHLAQVLAELGGAEAKREGRAGWSGVRMREARERLKKRVIASWEERLETDGMPGELPSIRSKFKGAWTTEGAESSPKGATSGQRWKELAEEVRFRWAVADQVFTVACAYYWEHSWSCSFEKDVWEKWAIERMSVREIAADLKTAKSYIGRIITKHRGRCGLV